MRKREEILSANPIKGTIPFSESMSQILLLEVLLDIRELLGFGADEEKMVRIPEKPNPALIDYQTKEGGG